MCFLYSFEEVQRIEGMVDNHGLSMTMEQMVVAAPEHPTGLGKSDHVQRHTEGHEAVPRAGVHAQAAPPCRRSACYASFANVVLRTGCTCCSPAWQPVRPAGLDLLHLGLIITSGEAASQVLGV